MDARTRDDRRASHARGRTLRTKPEGESSDRAHPVRSAATGCEVMVQAAVFDTKPYDREALEKASLGENIEWRFQEWRLSAETAMSAGGMQAICVFVNDRADRPCLEVLSSLGVKHIALRCAGFNSVDLTAAKELGFAVSRVPAYSPYAVAEHAVALLLALNRKIPRANN